MASNSCDLVRCHFILWCQARTEQQRFHVGVRRQRAPRTSAAVKCVGVQNEGGTIVLATAVGMLSSSVETNQTVKHDMEMAGSLET